jgi:hypothetical protein
MKNIAKTLWALPVTIVGHLIAWTMVFLKGYEFIRIEDRVSYFHVSDNAPAFVKKLWNKWAGNTIGEVIVMNVPVDSSYWNFIKIHELEHVRQCRKQGIFTPVVYLCGMLSAWASDENPYSMNPAEIAARRAAGEKIEK